jgi:hypothetical protein
MKRFHFAIRAIEKDILRHIGKVTVDAVEKKHDDILYGYRSDKVQNMREAIKILEEHDKNKFV